MKPKQHARRKRVFFVIVGALAVLGAFAFNLKQQYLGDIPLEMAAMKLNPLVAHDADSRPSQLTLWPWPNAEKSAPHKGVAAWTKTAPDGTLLRLVQFDFTLNPNLQFEIFDQDEDDEKPWDNNVEYWPRGVGQITKKLNSQRRGRVVAAWNGLFFGYREGGAMVGGGGHAFHVSPVVIDGKVHSFGANHRWTFGIEYSKSGARTFSIAHLPSKNVLQRFRWAGGSAQCLLLDGEPLRLQPFPKAGDKPLKQPVSSTPQDVGHIPLFDHMKTCRASIAWSRDSRKMWVLWVKEPDSESGSAFAMRRGLPVGGGWTVPDLQRFWLSMKNVGVSTAVNSDAGDVLQATLLRSDNNYDLIPPGWATRAYTMKTFAPDFADAPQGGSLMYFVVRDTQTP